MFLFINIEVKFQVITIFLNERQHLKPFQQHDFLTNYLFHIETKENIN